MNVILTVAYLAPVEYYGRLVNAQQTIIEQYDNFVKQTYRNRCVIASANGLQTLSIPIIKPDSGKSLTRDIQIAEHGDWRHLHWHAIVSAYNSSPFFKYYIDNFRPFYKKRMKFLFDFNERLRETVCSLLNIIPTLSYSTQYNKAFSLQDWDDLRETIHPKKKGTAKYFQPYYQVFDRKYGFQSNLSIIDLLFNMGPEAIVVLEDFFINK